MAFECLLLGSHNFAVSALGLFVKWPLHKAYTFSSNDYHESLVVMYVHLGDKQRQQNVLSWFSFVV